MEQHFQRTSLLNHPPGHEKRDAAIRPILLTGLGLALSLALVGLIIYVIFRYLERHPVANVESNPMTVLDPQIPPPPRVEEHPALEIQQLHAAEDQMLSTYGWIDKSNGVVRIPLDRALDLQMERGFPARKEPAQR